MKEIKKEGIIVKNYLMKSNQTLERLNISYFIKGDINFESKDDLLILENDSLSLIIKIKGNNNKSLFECYSCKKENNKIISDIENKELFDSLEDSIIGTVQNYFKSFVYEQIDDVIKKIVFNKVSQNEDDILISFEKKIKDTLNLMGFNFLKENDNSYILEMIDHPYSRLIKLNEFGGFSSYRNDQVVSSSNKSIKISSLSETINFVVEKMVCEFLIKKKLYSKTSLTSIVDEFSKNYHETNPMGKILEKLENMGYKPVNFNIEHVNYETNNRNIINFENSDKSLLINLYRMASGKYEVTGYETQITKKDRKFSIKNK